MQTSACAEWHGKALHLTSRHLVVIHIYAAGAQIALEGHIQAITSSTWPTLFGVICRSPSQHSPPGISWSYTSVLLERRSLSKGAYSARVPSQKLLIALTLAGSSPVSRESPARDATSAPRLGWLVVPAHNYYIC